MEKKLSNFLHHVDYEHSGLNLKDLENLINEKRVMYDHSIDKKGNKWGQGGKLEKININEMPKYVLENLEKYKLWLEL